MSGVKILFVCAGNICRSPMAEFILKKMATDSGICERVQIDSCATNDDEIGKDIYPDAKKILAKHNIPTSPRKARQFTINDYDTYNYIIVMDNDNYNKITRLIKKDTDSKILPLSHFNNSNEDIEDPWITGDFEKVFSKIYSACLSISKILSESNILL